ncbi:MAG TPA: FAD-binding oxidoreductase [Actinomycetota bacterium]|nr:FAD-binding oxidoreductase [Actinomycetota bacterium]
METAEGSEVLVVGAGIVGAATAYELARRGVNVTLLEGRRPAWGASGRNPGFVWLHTRATGVQMELGLAGRGLYDELVQELDGFEFRESGGMTYFFEEEAELFPAFVEERRTGGLPMELLDRDDARRACPILPPNVAGATFNPLDAHINTELLVRSLCAAAERLGADIVAERTVTHLLADGDRCVGAATADGELPADHVVVAAGVWSGPLVEPFGARVPIEPMRLQLVETEPLDLRFDPILYGPTALKQYAFVKELPGYRPDLLAHPVEQLASGIEVLELAAQRRDGRVLLGCPMDFPGLDDRATVAGLGLTLTVLVDHLPALRDVGVSRTWAGLLPQTPDALPILGPLPGVEGLWLATGHVFGNLAGPISGRLVAQMLVGEEPVLDPAPFRTDREALQEAGSGLRRW